MKIVKRIIFTLLAVCSVLLDNPISIQAEDGPGYVFDDLQVIVEVNEKREYHVIETMTIDFQQELHGIVRDIPRNSSVEKVEVKDIKVDGMPYQVQSDIDQISIKIGDPDKTVSGKQKLTLSYTLTHYQDYDHDHDYIYVNVLGSDYDTEVKQFHAEVRFPFMDSLESYRVVSGKKGSIFNHYVKERMEDHTLIMDAKDVLRAQIGVTAQLRFEEGTFKEAPIYEYPYVIKNNRMQVILNEEQDFIVSQTLDLQVNYTSMDIMVPLISSQWDQKQYKIQDVNVSNQLVIDREDDHMRIHGTKGEHTITIQYRVHPYQIMEDSMVLSLNDPKEDTQIQAFEFTMETPYQLDPIVKLERDGDETKQDRFEVETSEHQLILKTKDRLEAAESFQLGLTLDPSYFHRSSSMKQWIAVLFSIIILIITAFFRLVRYRKEDLITPVEFYPPKGINSAEAGYIIDKKISDTDITSLIFYWADKGYLKIHHIQDAYYFEKRKPVDADAPVYEQAFFRKMFAHGSDGIVKKEQLRHLFYQDIQDANQGIQKLYSGTYALVDQKVEKLRKRMILLSVFAVILYQLLSVYEVYQDFSRILLVMICVLPAFYLISMLLKTADRLKKEGAGFARGMLYCFIAFLFGGFLLVLQLKLTLGVCICLTCLVITLLLSRGFCFDTAYRKELLTILLGFKEFIKTAEKDQLEMMLKEDPEYYYHVLPYAQVLHVSDIWINKFKDISVVPPQWYDGEDTFRYGMLSNMMHEIEQDMQFATSHSASSKGSFHSSQDGYSGDGKGFLDHGSTGGGSGGGGSHGW